MKVWVAAENDLARPDGPSEHLTGLWNAMRRRGHEVMLSVPPLTGSPARAMEFELDAPALGWGPRQLAFQTSLWRRWRKYFKNGRPDCVYLRAGQWLLAPALFARRNHIPLFVEVNGISARHLAARRFGAPAARTSAWIERFNCSHASRVLAISPSVADWLTQKYKLSAGQVSLVPTGVDCNEFSPADEKTRLACRQRFGIGLGPEVQIGYVGTFDWWQGLPNLFQALAGMQERGGGGEWKAVIAGFGAEEEEEKLRALARELKLDVRLRFLGKLRTEDVPDFMRAIDVGVLPRTDYAPTPTKLLQYFAAGLASVYPALPDLVWLGEAGLTYESVPPARAAAGLAGALTQVCEKAVLRAELGRRSRELCLARFDWKIVAEKVETLLAR